MSARKFLWILMFFSFFAQAAPKKSVVAAKPVLPQTKKLKVVTTLSVLAQLVKEIAGNEALVHALSTASEDPHFVKAKPTFRKLVSDADLFIQIGRSLELWVPLVISSSQNPRLGPGAGLIVASSVTKALEVPKTLSRARGDIHPQGNPHVWLSPSATLKMADNIKDALSKARPGKKALFDKNFSNFKRKMAEHLFGAELVKSAGSIDFLMRLHYGKKLGEYLVRHKTNLGGWLKEAQGLDYQMFTYHTVFSYLADEFGLKIVGQVEEKSGVAPTIRFQNQLVQKAKSMGIKHIVAASYYRGKSKLLESIAQKIGGRKTFLQVDCSENESYFDMMNRIIKRLVEFKSAQGLSDATKK